MNWWEKDTFVERMFETNGQDESAFNAEVHRILHQHRRRAAIEPYVTLATGRYQYLKVIWEKLYGRYRRTTAPLHGGTTQVASRSSGTYGFSGSFGTGSADSVAAPAIEDAGIRAGEVVAYRCWILRDGLLHSAYQSSFRWNPGENVDGDPSKPSEGVHAFKKRLDACSYISGYEDTDNIVVSGTVELWGVVYEHSRGYRGEKARIASIDDSPNYDAAALRKLYGLNKKIKKK